MYGIELNVVYQQHRINVGFFFYSPCTPSEEKDILVCIITATQLSCNYTGTWFDRTSQG